MALLETISEAIHSVSTYRAHAPALSLEFHLSIHQPALHPHAEAGVVLGSVAVEKLGEGGLELLVDYSELVVFDIGFRRGWHALGR